MEFRVGQIIAKCAGCGGADFRKPEDEYSGPQMHYVCSGCGQTTRYAKLITQIGREAMRQRRERMAAPRPAVERTQRASRPGR